MVLSTYERLRIVHRTELLQQTKPVALQHFVDALPVYFDEIEATRPGLREEVAGCRDYVKRLRAYLDSHAEIDYKRIVEGLHRCLASLFS